MTMMTSPKMDVLAAIIANARRFSMRRTLYEYCREQGFTAINFDLIYGLPGQTLAGWEQCIRSIIEMAPDRLAVYSYAHLPENIKHQAKIDAAALPSAEAKSALIALARGLLVNAGYNAIGMDHFARPGDELCVASKDGRLHRNFMGVHHHRRYPNDWYRTLRNQFRGKRVCAK